MQYKREDELSRNQEYERLCILWSKLLFPHKAFPRYTQQSQKRQPKTEHRKKPSNPENLSRHILLESTEESVLLLLGLETTVTELGRGIDPLELDLLEGLAGSVGEEGLADRHDTLLGTWNRALDNDKVVADLTIAGEATKRSDGLLGNVELGRGVASVVTLADPVDLVVDGHTVVVTVLTSTGNSPLDVVGMPGTDTSNLAETLVGLAGKLLGTPTGSDTLETLTLGNGDDVDNLVLLEDRVDGDRLLEEIAGKVNLLLDGTAVDLDLHEVGLLLLERGLADLRVDEQANNSAVLLDTGKLVRNLLSALGVLLGVLGESLLLGLVPVLVEAAADVVGQVLSEDGGEGALAAGGLNVTNDTDGDHLPIQSIPIPPKLLVGTYRRSLDDGDSLNNLLLVHLGARTVKVTDGGSHTSLVTESGGQVDGLLLIILREGLFAK